MYPAAELCLLGHPCKHPAAPCLRDAPLFFPCRALMRTLSWGETNQRPGEGSEQGGRGGWGGEGALWVQRVVLKGGCAFPPPAALLNHRLHLPCRRFEGSAARLQRAPTFRWRREVSWRKAQTKPTHRSFPPRYKVPAVSKHRKMQGYSPGRFVDVTNNVDGVEREQLEDIALQGDPTGAIDIGCSEVVQ